MRSLTLRALTTILFLLSYPLTDLPRALQCYACLSIACQQRNYGVSECVNSTSCTKYEHVFRPHNQHQRSYFEVHMCSSEACRETTDEELTVCKASEKFGQQGCVRRFCCNSTLCNGQYSPSTLVTTQPLFLLMLTFCHFLV